MHLIQRIVYDSHLLNDVDRLLNKLAMQLESHLQAHV